MPEGFDQLFNLLDQLAKPEKALRSAVISTHALHSARIFGQGKAADGTLIGKYSKEETYVSNKQSPVKMIPKGKTGRTKFKDGTPHKSRYFEKGYFEFRQTIGRQSGKVDLRLTGQMQNDYQVDARGEIYVSGFSNTTNYKKATGNEDRFGKKIFKLSADEQEAFLNAFNTELSRIQ